jgi:hypothetical protein
VTSFILVKSHNFIKLFCKINLTACQTGQKVGEKIRPSFEKVAKTIAERKIAQIPITKQNLKFPKFYIKPLLTPKNTNNKPYFETAYLGENVKKLLKQKVLKNVAIFGATSSFQNVTLGIRK